MTKSDDLLFHAGHRERLKERLLDGKLVSYEKLELLLTYAIPRRDVRPLARALIARFGNVYLVMSASVPDLMSVPGVGRSAAILIKLMHELFIVSHTEQITEGKILSDPAVIHAYCRRILTGKPVEELHILYLGPHQRLLLDETHSVGTIDYSDAYPREIARKALSLNSVSIIIAHNHPVSDNTFSRDDINLTKMLEAQLSIFNISLHDHYLVTGSGNVISYRNCPWAGTDSFRR